MMICLASVARAFYTQNFASGIVLYSFIGFVASFAFSQGTIIWVILSEVFPNRVRAKGQALATFIHWCMAAAISWCFPVIAQVSGGHAFGFFAAMMFLQLLFAIFILPETKGISLEQMQEKLHIE